MLKKLDNKARTLRFSFRKHTISVLIDKVLIFRFIRTLHGRFWGIATIFVMTAGFTIGFIIRPDMLQMKTALSDFANDFRTAPYFTISIFFAAYGLWRWRNYLSRTWIRKTPITGLIMLTVFGLYLVALMPEGWRPVPYYLHMFGLILAGLSMLVTVMLDYLLTKTRKSRLRGFRRTTRFITMILIVVGGIITFGSTSTAHWFHISLFGEILLLAGYFAWVTLKTYEGEGNESAIYRLLNRLIKIQ